MPFTVAEIARRLGGEVVGNPGIVITGLAQADQARAGHLTFAENEAYFGRAEQSSAAAIMVTGPFTSASKTLIRVSNARVAFAKVMALFFPEPPPPSGVHPSAVVAASAQVHPTAYIGPHCVVGERVRIGARTVLFGGNHVGDDTQLGDDVRLFPNAVIYHRCQVGHRVRLHAGAVVGSDGYGYVLDEGIQLKIPQIGNVVLHDDVEIGANTTVARAALGSTVIGRGSKLDNLVMIGHNVVVGENCILISQVGVAGSTQVGNNVTLAGQVGLAGHLKIGHHVTIAAQSGVMNNIPDEETWLGTPARPDRQMKRIYIALERLPELLRRVKALERQPEKPQA